MRKYRGLIPIILLLPACLSAQKVPPPQHVSVDALTAAIQAGRLDAAGGDALAGILSQRRAGYSAQDRARLEAALVESGVTDSAAALTAIAALARAGAASALVPLPTAFDDLRRLYENAPSLGSRGAALGLMSHLADRPQVLPFWGSVAADSTGSFFTAPLQAIRLLADEGGAEGRHILQQLYAGKQVKNPDARSQLELMAARGFFGSRSQPR